MTTAQQPNAARPVVQLTEYATCVLPGVRLGDARAVERAAALREKINIRETSTGLEITATQWVGRVDVGPVRVVVRPKLPQAPLTCLLRYAYRLRDLDIREETQTPTGQGGFHDLLATMLAMETAALIQQGLAKRHIERAEKLASPRGRIAIGEIARQGGVIEARLPCRYFDRRVDWRLNQIVRAGLDATAARCEDRDLRHRLHRLASAFPAADPRVPATKASLAQAQSELTRLTAPYDPVLALLGLLQDMHGVELELPDGQVRVEGYLFDMNMFFQRLVSRFLHDHLQTHRIEDETAVRRIFAYAPGGNPRGRNTPQVRPDYALFQGKTLRAYLDAKYRDVWSEGNRNSWLYQLAIYALASPTQTSVMLYASMSGEASDETIELRHPIAGSNDRATIILRPVPLVHLAGLLSPGNKHRALTERRQTAEALISLDRRSR